MSTRAYGLLLSIVTSAALSCSSDDGGDTKKPDSAKNEYAEYAIHVVAKTKNGEVLVDFPPVSALSAPGVATGPKSSPASAGPGSKPMVSVESDGGAVIVDLYQGPAFRLVMRAVGQCYAGTEDLPLAPPWMPEDGLDSWFVFRGKLDESGMAKFESCEEILAKEELLLCAADKLKEIADAVAPVTWGAIDRPTFIESPAGAQPPSYMSDPWVIPPQNSKDKFVVRDLAINVLANLARLDLEPPDRGIPGETCADAWVQSATDESYFTNNSTFIYGSSAIFDPATPINASNRMTLGQIRLIHNTQTLRAAGRLLRELIDDSVMADLAGAERQRARAADPGRGPELYWGKRTDSDAPYNSLAHAFRVVFGRWESPRPQTWGPPPTFGVEQAPVPAGDPACGSYAPLELLTEAMGPSISARWQDRRVRKPAQQFATQLVDRAGIVVPKTAMDAQWSAGSFGTVVGAVKKQLVLSAALEAGFTSVNDQGFASRKTAIESMVDGVDQADLRFALDRSFGAYRLLAGAAEAIPIVPPFSADVKLVGSTELDADLSSIGGNVVKAGMQRPDITTDIMARVGPAQAASQCFDAVTPSVAWGAANLGKVAAFRDAFMIGDTFRRRLSQTRQLTAGWTDSDFPKLADAGATELRTWTGPAYGSFMDAGGIMYLRLYGLAPEDLGVSTRAEMKGRIVAVWGKPWVADCAAKLRQSCPENFEGDYVRLPWNEMVSEVNGEIPDYATYRGADERVMELWIPLNAGPGFFTPQATSLGSAAEDVLYLVSKTDPKNPGFGKVLASIAYRSYPDVQRPTYFLVSDYQRKLANDIFGVSGKWGVRGPKVGEQSSGSSPGYCIPGVPRDFFVPLENELTSDSDSFESSWKHYLTLAKQAAAETDALGEELIRLGLQQDFRREAAAEEIGKICGDFTALQDVEVKAGKLEATSADSTLNDCINEPTYEMVFLTTKPPPEVVIKDSILHCAPLYGQNDNPLCKKDETEIESPENSAGLGVVEYYDPESEGKTEPGDCDVQLGIVSSLSSGFKGMELAKIAASEGVSPGRMASVIGPMRLTVNENLDWGVELDSAPIMSTTDANYWPACGSCGQVSDPVKKKLAENLYKTFGEIVNINSSSDRDALLQQVTGAMWLMAAMSGYLPDNVFALPIPAANNWNSESLVNAATIYGKAQFEWNGTSGIYQLTPDNGDGGGIITPNDHKIINKANGQIINYPFKNAVVASTQRPQWQKDIYADDANHIHLMASNADRAFPAQPGIVSFISTQGQLLEGAKANAASGACEKDVKDLEKQKAIAEHLKVKYPEKGMEKVCATQDGKSALLVARQKESFVQDLFVWKKGQNRDVTKVIPQYQGSGTGDHYGNPQWFDDNGLTPADCKHDLGGTPFKVGKVKVGCIRDAHFPDPWQFNHTRFTRSALLPAACAPQNRVQLFVNSNNPKSSGCEVARELSQAIALTCVLGAGYKSILPGDDLPQLNTPDDIAKLETWLLDKSVDMRKQLSKLYLTKVPKRVVDDAKEGKVGTGTYSGEHGQLVAQYREHLSAIATGWLDVSSSLSQLSGAIGRAGISLQAADIATSAELTQYAMDEIGLHAAIAKAAVQATVGITNSALPYNGPTGAGQAASAMIDAQAFVQQLVLMQKLKDLSKAKNANAVAGVLTTLSNETNVHYTNIQKALESLRTSVVEALKTATALRDKENEAKYQAAKGLGADWAYDSNGKIVTYPVNTVLRRQYDITQRRYEASLNNAKYLAYMARLAIEQRIGMRLDDIDDPVKPMEEAPSKWAEDVCSFQGVDYQKLRAAATPESNILEVVESYAWDKYVNPYIGDYVDKLEKFVEFYNIQYPSHEGDDTAVLSVRDDLLGPQGTCFRPSKNLLFFSHDLTRLEAGSDDGTEPPRGWMRAACDSEDPKCLVVAPGSILELSSSPLAPPGIAPSEGITWLYNSSAADMNQVDAGLDAGAGASGAEPPGSVYQSVELPAGSFVLSWFDRAWGQSASDEGPLPAGGPDAGAGSPADYFAGVYDSNWALVATFTGPPHVPSGSGDGGAAGGPWSERRVIALTTTSAGTHHVVFSPTGAGASFGSVAIADVQLEQAPSASSVGPYEATGASRLILTGSCAAGDAEVFRNAFGYSCDAKNCFHELRVPFNVKLGEALAGSALAGKVAQDNYNYRHVNLALNVVGTGVVDCAKTPTPSCFGSPYVEYTLEHVAFAVPIINHTDKPYEFDFGLGAVRFGKALAAERFITLPVSSADQGLLSQPAFTKVELRGRPLEGTYRLRVYDSPALNWTQVEDIQVVLDYRYWSRIEKSSQQK